MDKEKVVRTLWPQLSFPPPPPSAPVEIVID